MGATSVIVALVLIGSLSAPSHAERVVWRSMLHPSDSLIISRDESGEGKLHAPARFLALGFWEYNSFTGIARLPDVDPGSPTHGPVRYRPLDAFYSGASLISIMMREGADDAWSEPEFWELTIESRPEFEARMPRRAAFKNPGDGIPEAFDLAPSDRAPQVLKAVPPAYPDSARVAGIQGTVLVRALIGRNGRVLRTVIERSVPGLDESSRRAVMLWSFKPARYRGRTVPRWRTVPCRYSL